MAQDITTGLVAHWTFDETSGSTAADSSGNGNNGTAVNHSWDPNGQVGGCIELDGSFDYVQVSNSSSLQISGEITIAAWVRPDSVSGQHCIVGHGPTSSAVQNTYLYAWLGDWLGGSNNGSDQFAQSAAASGGWVHLVSVYNGSQWRLFANGVLVDTHTTSQGAVNVSGRWGIGAPSSYSSRFFDGLIDEVRIYNRGLSDTDVTALYAYGGASGGLIAHYKLDEGSGSTVSDSSGQGANAAFDDGTPTWTSGVRFGAIDFAGTSDVETDADFDPPAAGSIAFWFRSNNTPTGNERLLGVSGFWEVRTDATGTLYFDLNGGSGGGSITTASGVAAAGEWRHVVVMYNADDDDYSLYLDGVLISSGAYTADDAAAGRLTLGSRTGSAERFDGALDDVRIYGYEISEAEVAELYGLVGHWRLNESSGTTAADSSLNDNDGLHGLGVTVGDSGPNSQLAADYDGSNNQTEVTHGGDWNAVDNQFSLATWVRIDAGSDTHGLIIWDDASTPYALLVDSSNRPSMRINWSSSGSVSHTAAGTLTVGQWHHVAVTYDGSTVRFYIDGVQDGSTLSASTTVDTSSSEMQIGGDDGSSYDLTGALYDARVYNRALLSDEITNLAGSTNIVDFAGHWKLDETSGTVAADSSGAGNDGTYTNSPTLGTSAPRGYAATFDSDAASQYIDLPHTVLDGATAVTVCWWMRTTQSGQQAILSAYPSSGTGNELLVQFETATTFRPVVENGAPSYSVAGIDDGRWHHFVYLLDRPNGVERLYRDGELEVDATRTATSNTIDVPSGGLVLAQDQDSVGGGFSSAQDLDGDLDDVRIYRRIITDEEIAEIYGLLGHWKFNEASGTTASDSSGAGNDATLTGTTAWTSGLRANALDMTTGAEGTVNTLFNEPESFSIAAWAELDTADSGGSEIINIGNYIGLRLDSGGSDVTAFYRHTSGWTGVSTTSASAGKGWRQYVVTFDDTLNQIKLYINGEEVASNTLSQSIDWNGFWSYATLGGLAGSSDYHFDGKLDDVAFYNRAMLREEIAEHYGLIGHWEFDEGTGTTIQDASFNANDASFGTGSPEWITGVRGNALRFDGTNDAATDAAFDPPEEGCVSFWVRCDATPTARQRPFGLADTFEAWQDPDGILHFDLNWSGAPDTLHPTEAFTFESRWRHVAVNFRSSNDAYEVYFDGQLDISGIYPSDLIDRAANVMSFGTRTGSTQRFTGALDDFRVYSRWLTASEVAEQYGLVGHWRMEEISGTVAADSSGLGSDGTFSGSATWSTDAKEGTGSLELDGADYVEVPGLAVESAVDGVTIAGWAKLTGADTGGAEVISLGDHFAIRLDDSSGGSRAFAYDGTAWQHATNNTSYENAGWHHFAAIYDASDLSVEFYVDGVLRATQTMPAPLDLSSLGTTIRIGEHGNGETTRSFTGNVDDLRVYNRAITRDEARSLFYGEYVPGLRIISWVEVANP